MSARLPSGRKVVSLRSMSIPVLFADLDFKVDGRLSATAWNGGLSRGARRDVIVGTTVIVTDGEDAFYATVVTCDEVGPQYIIHWNKPAPKPAIA